MIYSDEIYSISKREGIVFIKLTTSLPSELQLTETTVKLLLEHLSGVLAARNDDDYVYNKDGIYLGR